MSEVANSAAYPRTLLILAVRFGAGLLRERGLRFGSGCVLRTGSGCVLRIGAGCSLRTGRGCVLRTASASISRSSALFGVEGFVISPLFLFRLRGFPSQALGPQSLVVFSEGFLRCLIFRYGLPFTGALKRPHQVSSR